MCHDAGVPSSCCSGERLDIFGERGARRELRRYLRRGLGGEARLLAAWAEEGGLDGATVLEVGGGIGQVQAELVRRGAARGCVVELLAAYEEPARELAQSLGLEARSAFLLADLLEQPEAVEPAEIVVLRRVVCCSPAGPALLGAAAGKARRTLLASYPRDRAAVRVVARLQNGILALVRKRFRVFVHPPAQLERAAARHGLERTRVARGAIWETVRFDVASP